MTAIVSLAVDVLLLAPLLALAAGFFFFHPRRPERAHWPMLASCWLAAAASLVLAWAVHSGGFWDFTLYHWVWGIDFGVRVDALSAYVLAMVCVVGGLIHCYAAGYMKGDPGFSRFFLYFHFFLLSMIGLLLSNNYLQMYLFWEGVGLSSFLLIAFWSERASARAAAWKAFLTNRIGDVAFLMAVFLMLNKAGTAGFDGVFLHPQLGRWAAALSLLLFWAACAKSAQFPLYGWLPDAMEGPTPVSALMHAATMVAAGVFLMARSWPILRHAPEVLRLVAWVGAGTSLGAALFASVKKDLKRILAYSTVSQLGLMMLAIGVGEVAGAVFHLVAHGFFKALLFLCAGNVIHGLPGHRSSAGVDETGGLFRRLPWTYAAFWAGALGLGGFFPFSGFFSKDMILAGVYESGSLGLKILASLVAAGSGFYIFRMFFLTFHGERPEQKGPAEGVHEADAWMVVPVLLLALGSLALSAAGPRLHVPSFGLAASATGLAFIGAAGAFVLCVLRPSWDWEWRARSPELERRLDADLGWQELSARPARAVSAFARALASGLDERIWDAWTEAAADSCLGLGEGLSGLSRGLVNEYLWWMLAGTAVAAYFIVLCS